MSINFSIRQAELNDINAIMQINRKCLPENYSFDFFYYVISEFGDVCVVSETKGQVIGYVLSRIERPLSSFIGIQSTKGHIISIAVLPEYRRKGIALNMMKYALQKLIEKKVQTIYLEVRISNLAAIELYNKLGFKIKRQLKHYYRDGESAFLMEWGASEK
ncbi:MAG: ribosomal protein S18-alanine N-acetyltransferase [Candidatus Heimdallarchaeaceae archaeon]